MYQAIVLGRPAQNWKQGDPWGYLTEADVCRQLFLRHPRFAQMPPEGRRVVAGIEPPPERRWFGAMGAAARFSQIVVRAPTQIGQVLDAIPVQGPVTTGHIQAYVASMLKIDGVNIATATRLLAMKRPDVAVPCTAANYFHMSRELAPLKLPKLSVPKECQAILEAAKDYAILLDRIWHSPWWQSPRPATPRSAVIWEARVALLDTVFYDPDPSSL
jgi:hypothetical protein